MRKTNEQKTKHKIPKTNKGITLIALVITIIVMLILAAVTISMAVNGGLFDYAGKAVGETQNAINEEQLLADGKVKVDGIWYDSIDSYIDGTMSQDNTLLGLYKAGKLKVGDYVDYTPSSAEPYNPDDPERTGTAEAGTLTGYTEEVQNTYNSTFAEQISEIEQEDLTWRVLGSDGDNLLLISGAPTITGGIAFYGHVGYKNYENVLNDTCSNLYSNSELGVTARSINLNDIDTYLGGSAFDKTTAEGGSTSPGGYGYTTTLSNIYVPENWVGTNTKELTSNAYAYMISDVIKDSTKVDLLIYNKYVAPGNFYSGAAKYSTCFSYWVADTSMIVWNNSAYYCPTVVYTGLVYGTTFSALCTSSGNESIFDESGSGTGTFSLRPVVSIPANVTIEQVPIMTTAPTELWYDPFLQIIPM